MPTASPEKKALEGALKALTESLSDPSPRPLVGTAKAPGFFKGGTAPVKRAAKLCEDRGWVEKTGRTAGKSKKELYRLTPSGVEAALENLPDPGRTACDVLQQMGEAGPKLEELQKKTQILARSVTRLSEQLARQGDVIRAAAERFRPLDVAKVVAAVSSGGSGSSGSARNDAWLEDAVGYVVEYRRRNPFGSCPLPELYGAVGKSRELSIGAFHDGLRLLAEKRRIVLEAFTGAPSALKDSVYALVTGQEIKYYAAPGNR